MIQIHINLYIGNQDDYEFNVKNQPNWAIVHACKEPYHRQVLGYTGRGAPKDHAEYLIAQRGNRLILNLIDVDNYQYIPKEIIDRALEFIEESLDKNLNVLVHCNQGESRGPSIGFLYLVKHKIINQTTFEEAVAEFKKIYPLYNPARGILDYMKINWNHYCSWQY